MGLTSFVESFNSLKEFKDYWASRVGFTNRGFFEQHRKLTLTLDALAASAKIYILDNYNLIEDWSELIITLPTGYGKARKKITYLKHHNPHPPDDCEWDKIFEEINNPVTSFSDVLLDTSDGDFSVTVNGTIHPWIDDDSIIRIASYIERQLRKQNIQASKKTRG